MNNELIVLIDKLTRKLGIQFVIRYHDFAYWLSTYKYPGGFDDIAQLTLDTDEKFIDEIKTLINDYISEKELEAIKSREYQSDINQSLGILGE